MDDALRDDPGERFDMVLTNPPFGRSSSDSYEREDFWAATKNKQLNFRPARSQPAQNRWHRAQWWFLTTCCSRPVLAKLSAADSFTTAMSTPCSDSRPASSTPRASKPTSCSSADGEGAEQAWTKELWVYDLRTNKHFTLKQNPLTRGDLNDFVACFNPANRHQRQEADRFKRYTYDELIARDKVSLDLFWLRDDSLEDIDNLPAPSVLAAEIAEDLQSALTEIQALSESLTANGNPL